MPAPPTVAKKHFFTPRSEAPVMAPIAAVVAEKPRVYQPRRRFLVDENTDVAYAEVIDGMAVCMDTGVDLFEVHRRQDDEYTVEDAGPLFRFNYSAPSSRHPCDPTIVSQDLIDAGVLTEGSFREGKAGLSRAEYEKWVARDF